MSPRETSRSITIKTPVIVAEHSSAALTNSSIISLDLSLFSLLSLLGMNLPRPTYSSPRLSSGWNKIIRATTPIVIVPLRIQLSVYRCKTSEIKNATTKTKIPLTSCCALVSLIKSSTLYTIRATIRMSSTSLIPNPVVRLIIKSFMPLSPLIFYTILLKNLPKFNSLAQ